MLYPGSATRLTPGNTYFVLSPGIIFGKTHMAVSHLVLGPLSSYAFTDLILVAVGT